MGQVDETMQTIGWYVKRWELSIVKRGMEVSDLNYVFIGVIDMASYMQGRNVFYSWKLENIADRSEWHCITRRLPIFS